MSLDASTRKTRLFLLVLGLLAPRVVVALIVCEAGWEWVSYPCVLRFQDDLSSQERSS